jgi:AAA15 family ATPase/GTPase
MLIDFTVENYRSIKDPVTLSMVAAPTKKTSAKSTTRRTIKPDHEIAPPFRLESRNLSLLPAVGIFGANASGKSNVIQALDKFLNLIMVGGDSVKSYYAHFIPFRLTNSPQESPTRFELRVIQNGIIFIYTLALNHARILHEKLEHIPPPPRMMKPRLLFERLWDEDAQAYIFTNGKDFGNAYKEIQESLHEREPFMSLLRNRLNVEVVKPFVLWLGGVWQGVGLGSEQEEYNFAARFLGESGRTLLEIVMQIVRRFDTDISAIEIELIGSDQDTGKREVKVWVIHEKSGERFRWLMEEESIGTQRLFSLAFKIVVAFYGGKLLMVDELGSNIHPNITKALVRMFQSEKTNPKRAQLIFTSHDNTLQRGNLLRRDQIWFTQKRADGSTELYPLSDFKPRNDLAIDKAYLEGRFGAVPILPDEEELLEPAEAK